MIRSLDHARRFFVKENELLERMDHWKTMMMTTLAEIGEGQNFEAVSGTV